jgi:hemolysin activation/secretion protein
VVGVRGGYKGLSYDWSVGTPLKKPDGFETANVTSAFTVIWSF